nr:hypothetical protein [Embleya scabrispora]
MPHLSSLGVDAIRPSPFHRSPMVDAGYDVPDPRDAGPRSAPSPTGMTTTCLRRADIGGST